MEEKQTAPHRTTARILDIIEYVAECPAGATLAEISRSLKIPKGSLHPLTSTLSNRGYLYYNTKEGRFYCGESLFIYGNKQINNADILEQIRSVMLEVNQKTGETLYFGVLSGLDVLYLIKMDLHSQFRVMSNPGNKLPAYSTSYGKALLAQYSRQQIEEFYPEGRLEPITTHTLATVDELNDQLDLVRRTGFAYEEEESTIGIQCVGVAIVVEKQVLAGLSIAVPLFRYTPEREQQFKILITKAKEKIEQIIAEQRIHWVFSGQGTIE